jgi:LPS export ABC transporter protein LptC
VKKRLSIPLLIGAGGLIYALVSTPPTLIAPPATPATSDEAVPQSYASGVTVSVFGENGELLDRTLARSLQRFGDAGVIELDAPQRFGFGGDAGWRASAESGELVEASDVLRLSGDVTLRYTDEGVEFRTQEMVIDIPQQTARSLTPVRAWQLDNETTADALWVHFEREVAVLSGNVRSVYRPEQ